MGLAEKENVAVSAEVTNKAKVVSANEVETVGRKLGHGVAGVAIENVTASTTVSVTQTSVHEPPSTDVADIQSRGSRYVKKAENARKMLLNVGRHTSTGKPRGKRSTDMLAMILRRAKYSLVSYNTRV